MNWDLIRVKRAWCPEWLWRAWIVRGQRIGQPWRFLFTRTAQGEDADAALAAWSAGDGPRDRN